MPSLWLLIDLFGGLIVENFCSRALMNTWAWRGPIDMTDVIKIVMVITGVAYARHRCVDPEGWLKRGIWEDT